MLCYNIIGLSSSLSPPPAQANIMGSPSQPPLPIIFMNPDPRKKSAFNLLLNLNDKNNDLSFAPNLVLFPNPKILVLQNDFFLSFLSSLFGKSYQEEKNNLITCTYIYFFMIFYYIALSHGQIEQITLIEKRQLILVQSFL